MDNLNKIICVLTFLIHILIAVTFKLLDNFSLIFTIYITSFVCGFLLKTYSKNKFKQIGWGMFYGSLIPLTIVAIFMFWFESNYPT